MFTKEDIDNIHTFDHITKTYLNHVNVTVDVFIKRLKSLNCSKSPGLDEIHPKFFFFEIEKEIVLLRKKKKCTSRQYTS